MDRSRILHWVPRRGVPGGSHGRTICMHVSRFLIMFWETTQLVDHLHWLQVHDTCWAYGLSRHMNSTFRIAGLLNGMESLSPVHFFLNLRHLDTLRQSGFLSPQPLLTLLNSMRKPEEGSISQRVQRLAKYRFLKKQSDLLLNSDDLAAMWNCLRENCVIDDGTGAEKMNYEDFCHIASVCTEQIGPKCRRFFSPSNFMKFEKDEAGRIAILPFYLYVMRTVSLTQARIDMSELDEDSDGFLQSQEMESYISGLIPNLAQLRDMPDAFTNTYCRIASQKFFFFCDPHRRESSFHFLITKLSRFMFMDLQIVAVKQLDRNGLQGNREFLVEVLMLSLLHHTNLVNLIGYCADGDQRLLVYEYMALGSLEDHLHDLPPGKEPLDWNTRMTIAAGAAKGLEYLHDKANPPVIYRDLKSSNILLGDGYHPKLSDFGLAKLGPVGDKTHVSTRVMGTYGYCAPEYAMTGQLTLKSDVYSFGVVFLELITGRKAIDNARAPGEHNLVAWARPLFKDRRKFPKMADPSLQGRYPMRGLYQALAVAAMCLQEQAATRPLIGDVVTALTYLASQTFDPNAPNGQNSRSGGGGGPPFIRTRDERRSLGDGSSLDSPAETRSRLGSPGTHKNSPDYRRRDMVREVNAGSEAGSEAGGGSGRKWGLSDVEGTESQRGSPASVGRGGRGTPRNRDLDRERAVAEAKVWGENWRERKRGTNGPGSFDSSND
ncbi:hypothetical protein F2Q68_00000650 [Brassica cretica]|uniref:Protein kinase domain-containing protein n=2 Tax=Brassica cretica TaxID=69181 RepID=A0A8S9JBS1_BRACR|nr:hypothetical protein F2Q68_00000650 [Brassica cretica]